MGKAQANRRFLFCLNNKGYAASLETRKIYRAIPDDAAEAKGFVRVVDESGEDYLYPAKRFIAVSLPNVAQRALTRVV